MITPTGGECIELKRLGVCMCAEARSSKFFSPTWQPIDRHFTTIGELVHDSAHCLRQLAGGKPAAHPFRVKAGSAWCFWRAKVQRGFDWPIATSSWPIVMAQYLDSRQSADRWRHPIFHQHFIAACSSSKPLEGSRWACVSPPHANIVCFKMPGILLVTNLVGDSIGSDQPFVTDVLPMVVSALLVWTSNCGLSSRVTFSLPVFISGEPCALILDLAVLDYPIVTHDLPRGNTWSATWWFFIYFGCFWFIGKQKIFTW